MLRDTGVIQPRAITIKLLSDPRYEAWLASHPDALIHQHPAWPYISQDSLGYRPTTLNFAHWSILIPFFRAPLLRRRASPGGIRLDQLLNVKLVTFNYGYRDGVESGLCQRYPAR